MFFCVRSVVFFILHSCKTLYTNGCTTLKIKFPQKISLLKNIRFSVFQWAFCLLTNAIAFPDKKNDFNSKSLILHFMWLISLRLSNQPVSWMYLGYFEWNLTSWARVSNHLLLTSQVFPPDVLNASTQLTIIVYDTPDFSAQYVTEVSKLFWSWKNWKQSTLKLLTSQKLQLINQIIFLIEGKMSVRF